MPATTKAFEMRNDEGRGSPPRLVLSPLLSGVGTQFLYAAMLKTVLLGHWRSIGLFRPMTRAQQNQAKEALAAVRLDGSHRRPVASLSAGQLQRVLFARMLLQDCPVILLDEPFTAIDAKTTAYLLRVVVGWHGEGRTVIAVLHDFEQVKENFPETLLNAREPIAWGSTKEALKAEHVFKERQMAEAWDDHGEVRQRRFG